MIGEGKEATKEFEKLDSAEHKMLKRAQHDRREKVRDGSKLECKRE